MSVHPCLPRRGFIQAYSLATLQRHPQEHGAALRGPFHPSFTAWLRCSSFASPMASWRAFHPSFTAWLRCSPNSLRALSALAGFIQALQLGYVAASTVMNRVRRCHWFHPSFTAWLRCSPSPFRREEGSPLGFHPSFTAWLRCSVDSDVLDVHPIPEVSSKLYSLATLQLYRQQLQPAPGGHRFIQALQLGYVAARTWPSFGRPCIGFHPSFTAWLRCRAKSKTEPLRVVHVSSKLCSLATLQLAQPPHGPPARRGFIQAAKLGYVASR